MSDSTEQKTPDEIRAEIEDVREDLGDTAAALAAKTDVKARAKEKVDDVKQKVAEKKEAIGGGSGTGFGPGSGSSDPGAPSPVDQLRAKAQANPIPTAAIAAFVGGFLLGRISSR